MLWVRLILLLIWVLISYLFCVDRLSFFSGKMLVVVNSECCGVIEWFSLVVMLLKVRLLG